MSFAVFFIAFLAVAVIVAIALLSRRHTQIRSWHQALGELQPINTAAFRLLTDPAEEAFMRRHVAGNVLKRLLLKRQKLTIAYLSAIGTNAALLLQVAEECERSSDADVRAAAAKLTRTAGALRIQVLVLSLQLRTRVILGDPSDRLAAARTAYESLGEAFSLLIKLQDPAAASRARAALQVG